MKFNPLVTAVFVALNLSAACVMAQESAWQSSYQLEPVGRYAEAIAALDRVSANSADAELKALRRGWLLCLSGKFDESIREYRQAIERNAKSVDARLGLTLALLTAKRWRDAEQSAHAALELSPNNYIALLRLTIALEAQRDWPAMLKSANNLVTSYPSDAAAYVYLARANAWLGKPDQAVVAYNAVLSRYPGQLEANAYLNKK